MGLFYDLYIAVRKKKRCAECGEIMLANFDLAFCDECIRKFDK